MKTFMIIIAIVLIIFTVLFTPFDILKRIQRFFNKERPKEHRISTPDFLKQIADIMAQDETEDDKVPGAFGEFGYDATNPIPTKGIPGSMAYLAKLRTENGVKVEYERKGQTRAENINHPIDIYVIRENGERICMLYFCPYYKENSAIAPKKFKIISTE
jgi:hypothetical protein